MNQFKKKISMLSFIIILLCCGSLLYGQEGRSQPQWWFGGAFGANVNFYSAGIHYLNSTAPSSRLPVTFSGGSGLGVYLSPLIEYRPDPQWGGMLALGFDGRNGGFDDVKAGGNTYQLITSMNYISLEPSVRFTPTDAGLYFFAGPRIGFNIAKTFTYTPPGGSKLQSEWTDIRGTVVSGQIGTGYDIPLNSSSSSSQSYISPFFSANLGQGPRSIETWSLGTLRAGVILKFGSSAIFGPAESRHVKFSVIAPSIIPTERKVKETFPVRNYIFFDEGSNALPGRYIQLTKDQADNFKEENLVQPEPNDLTSRSGRQMKVYYNILNVVGDRMRRNSQARVILFGSSDKGASEGEAFAVSAKRYLVEMFGIDGDRIGTQGRGKPSIPSAQPGGTRELDLVRPEDRRVEITSNTAAILEPVNIISIQDEPLDSDVLINVGDASTTLASWNVEITDQDGHVQRYGPFTSEQERIAGRKIIGDKLQGTYTVALIGESKDGKAVREEKPIRLVRSDQPEEEPGLRFSILFEFDQSKTVATYERFLVGTVAPLIPDGGSVTIHGHTDIVGEESHNLTLSRDRAEETRRIFERELAKAGKRNVKFDAYGFGEDVRRAPFDNKLPEERFYNRAVIIDIVPR